MVLYGVVATGQPTVATTILLALPLGWSVRRMVPSRRKVSTSMEPGKPRLHYTWNQAFRDKGMHPATKTNKFRLFHRF